jgi:hypothetical protein
MKHVIETAGVFAAGRCEWRKRPINERALANFKEHFKCHCDERARVLSAQAGGFHSANAVIMEQLQQANIATTGTTPGTVAVDAMVWGWCCTHGLTRNKTHVSQTCTKPCDGHKREATLTDPMGGSDKINFGNPRRNCRTQRERGGGDPVRAGGPSHFCPPRAVPHRYPSSRSPLVQRNAAAPAKGQMVPFSLFVAV